MTQLKTDTTEMLEWAAIVAHSFVFASLISKLPNVLHVYLIESPD